MRETVHSGRDLCRWWDRPLGLRLGLLNEAADDAVGTGSCVQIKKYYAGPIPWKASTYKDKYCR
jgi:hypothetical protein